MADEITVKDGTLGSFLDSQEQAVETAPVETTVTTEVATEQPAETQVVEAEKPDNESDFVAPEFTKQGTVAPKAEITDWREALKSNREEVLKEVGLDPFVIELDKYIKSGGSASDYLQAKGFDYNKVPDAVLAKQALQKEFPSFSDEKIEKLFNKKYSQSEYDSDEDKEMGAILLEGDAYKQRQDLIAEQAKLPEPAQQQTQQVDNSQIEAAQRFYAEHPQTKALMESKRVTVQLAEGVPFNFNIDKPEIVMQVMTDGGATFEMLTTMPTGEPDIAAKQEIALFALNRAKFKADIYNYGGQQMEKKIRKEGQNVGMPGKVLAQNTNESPSALWATARTGTLGG